MTTKERPILFSGEMVRAILAGRKTQTRRIIKPQPPEQLKPWLYDGIYQGWWGADKNHPDTTGLSWGCPYGQPSDQLWVREAWAELDADYHPKSGGCRTVYRADHITGNDGPDKITWRPSIFMRRADSRITLEVVAVRVERVQAISETDAVAEGCKADPYHPEKVTARYLFVDVWQTINAKRAPWNDNPWVWVVEFKQVSP